MDFENSIAFLLAKLSVAHRNMVEKAANKAGLHIGQVFVLFELWKVDGQRQIDLAQKLGLAAPTVNKILGGLLGNDFVTRERFENDARSTRIFLTQKGLDIREEIEAEWHILEAKTIAGLTDTESLMLHQLLTKLVIDLL